MAWPAKSRTSGLAAVPAESLIAARCLCYGVAKGL